MKSMVSIPAGVTFLIVFALTGCQIPTQEAASTGAKTPSRTADHQGNLVINNDTGMVLVLYSGDIPLKSIPDNSADFVVNVEHPVNSESDLRLYKVADVEADYTKPNAAKIYRRWTALLSNDPTKVADQATWRVKSGNSALTYGTLNFTYMAPTEYNAEVFLNTLTGSKLLSLSAGMQNKKVALEYGDYTLVYHYWKSSQGGVTGREEVGTIATEVRNAREVPIACSLTAGISKLDLTVPHWTPSVGVKYGSLRVTNQSPDGLTVKVYSGLQLIEDVAAFAGGASANMSSVAWGGTSTYSLPVGSYTLLAKDLYSGVVEESTTLTVAENAVVSWLVNGLAND